MPKLEKNAPESSDKVVAQVGEPAMVHYWSAQCVRCHRVGNMKAKSLPSEGLVCEGCLDVVGQVTAPPVAVE